MRDSPRGNTLNLEVSKLRMYSPTQQMLEFHTLSSVTHFHFQVPLKNVLKNDFHNDLNVIKVHSQIRGLIAYRHWRYKGT